MTSPVAEAVGLESAEFAREVLRAGTVYTGAPFFNHKIQASCDFGPTMPDCMQGGLGPRSIDCSGLIIRSISDVLGRRVSAWPAALRHVRQMRAGAEQLGPVITPGLLIIDESVISLDGREQRAATHIGIAINDRYKLHARSPEVNRGDILHGDNNEHMYVLDPLVLAKKVLTAN